MESPEQRQEPAAVTHAGRDAYSAVRDINITNNYSPPGHRETHVSAIQGNIDRVDLSKRLDLDRFTGRRQLIAQIKDFIATRNNGWVLVEGQAGVGKSALATYLADENGWFLHSTSIAGGSSRENARKNLAAQLIRAFELDAEYDPREQGDDADYLAAVLKSAAAKAVASATGRRPIVLVIDSLNEIDSAGQSVNPLGLPGTKALPSKVFVIATRRPISDPWSPGWPTLLADIETGAARELDEDDDAEESDGQPTGGHPDDPNAEDMREYLRELLEGAHQDQGLVQRLRNYDVEPAEFADTLVSKCAGVWIYLRLVLENVGKVSPRDVVFSLPLDVGAYFREQVLQMREPDHDQWLRLQCPALATLAALRRPVTFQELVDYAGIRDGDRGDLEDWLDNVASLLHVRENPVSYQLSYEVRHQSLREWVANPRTKDGLGRELRRAFREAHARITRRLIPPGQPGQRDWGNAGQYVHDMLAVHAAAAERPGTPDADPGFLDELVCDPGFLLTCQQSGVLLRRRFLKTTEGRRAVSAYEAALSEWAGLPSDDDSERAWRLHAWARKIGAGDLALASGKMARRTPVIQAAVWTGTTHRTIHAHDGSVGALTVLPVRDGYPLLASGGSDGRVRIWDLDTETPRGSGREAPGEGPLGHECWVTAAAAVPLPDQQVMLATGDRRGTVQFWDPRTGEPVGDPVTSRGGPVSVATVRRSDDRTVLAIAGQKGMVQVWDPAEGRSKGSFLVADGGEVTAVATVPTPAGQLLAAGLSDGSVWLLDPWTKEPVSDPLKGRQGRVSAIAVVMVQDDRIVLAAGGKDGMTIHQWDPTTRRPAEEPLADHTSAVSAITVARLAHRILFVTAGEGRKIRLRDAVTGAAVTFPVHARWVHAITTVALPDGRLLIATGGSDGKIELHELYESADGTLATAAPSTGHLGPVNAMAVAELADRTVLLVSGSRDRTVGLWKPDTGSPARQEPIAGHTGSVNAVAGMALPDGQTLIVTSGADGTVRLWDDPLAAKPVARLLKRYGQIHAIASVRLPDRPLLATGGSDGKIRLWEATGELVGGPLAGHVGPVNALTSLRFGDGPVLLASGGSDGSVRFWDPAAGAAVGGPLTGYGGRIRAVAAVPLRDGRTLVAAGGDYGVVQVWDGTDCTAVIEPPTDQAAAVNAIAAVELPDQTLLVTGNDDGAVWLWNPVTGAPPAAPLTGRLTGHDGPVRAIVSLRLPGERTMLATGGDDKTILIWAFDR